MNRKYVVAYMLATFIALGPTVGHHVNNQVILPDLLFSTNQHQHLLARSAMIKSPLEPSPNSQSLYVGIHPSSYLHIVDHASPEKNPAPQDSQKTPLFQNHANPSSSGLKQERSRRNDRILKQQAPQKGKKPQEYQQSHEERKSALASGKQFKTHINPLARTNSGVELSTMASKLETQSVNFAQTPPTSPRRRHPVSGMKVASNEGDKSEEVRIEIPGGDRSSKTKESTKTKTSTFHDGYGRLKRMIKKYPSTITATGVTAGTGMSAAGLLTGHNALLLSGSVTTCAFVGCQAMIEWYKGIIKTAKEKAERQKTQPSFRWARKKPKAKISPKPNSKTMEQGAMSSKAGHAASHAFSLNI